MKRPSLPPAFRVRQTFALAAMLACAAALAARPQQSRKNPKPTVKVSTGLVLLDVVATGKKDKPVPGLTEQDFRVFEDGKPQKIAYFRVVQPPSQVAPPAPLPPNVYTNLPAYHPANGPLTVVLLDSLNTPIFSQVRMRVALIRYLAKLMKQHRTVAILSLTDHLTVLQNFTASRGLLLAAAKKFTPQLSNQMAVRTEMTSHLKDDEYLDVLMAAKACQDCAALVHFYKTLKAQDRHILTASDEQRAEMTAQALQGIADALQGYPGRKNLIWVSEAFPPLYQGGPGMKMAYSVESQMHLAADRLNQARIAVYPVDARGLVTNVKPGPSEVDWAQMSQGSQYEAFPGYYYDSQLRPRSPMYNYFKSQATMRSIAEATGGVAYLNSNDISHAIARAAADSSDSYVIGYYPANRKWNGEFRRITVKPTQKGLHLRYRRGYYALPGFAAGKVKAGKLTNQQLQAALFDPLRATGILFRVALNQPASASPGKVNGRIFLSAGNGRLGPQCSVDLSFRVAALTPTGKIAVERGSHIQRQFSARQCSELRSGNLVFGFELPLKPGWYQLEFLVRDDRSGATGRVDASVHVKGS
jgi:VWFA-related protein